MGGSPFASIGEAVEEIRAGRMVVVCDDEDRENEGDLTMAAEKVTPADIAFMASHGRGLICVPMTEARLEELHLPQMVEENTARLGTAFTVSVEARGRTTTGISAYDRAETIRALIDPATRPEDLLRPGHTFPLRAMEGGVIRRAGQTEAAVDLARMAGLYPAGVVCEIMKDDGTMARVADLVGFCARHNLKMITVGALIEYRLASEKLVSRIAQANLPTTFGDFTALGYRNLLDRFTHVALVHGDVQIGEPLVRVHSECLTGDVFGSLRCDCGEQLEAAMTQIAAAECGVLVYLRQEGRGIGLANKLMAYELQDHGKDTVEANEALGFPPDLRNYGIGAQILRDVGVTHMRLLTNNPRKIVGLEGYGLHVVERVPLQIRANKVNAGYLMTKRLKLGHLFDDV
ncbi:MAG TPA: bifunctional 3,4-dihydroxy-2-butanone-4-phosphate synthase/GTP cyclohydrolase II [Chloroflexota bacterium]|nr:bifunctional 3,4-dihydroxy-2-butanone-4-phosphate synthase/GTP cyclohydrolase II [Chloroflexota bacterium]